MVTEATHFSSKEDCKISLDFDFPSNLQHDNNNSDYLTPSAKKYYLCPIGIHAKLRYSRDIKDLASVTTTQQCVTHGCLVVGSARR
jgi:hypothetical protein